MTAKDVIRKNFSRYAGRYDRYAAVQNLCGIHLLDIVKPGGFGSILDIGCGTGNYTRLLRGRYPGARIVAMDISAGMVGIARRKLRDERIEFIIADAENTDPGEGFDLISSNSSFQWFGDMERALSGYGRMLNKDGGISFSVFGPMTFHELGGCIKEASASSAPISSGGFRSKAEIERMMKALFGNVRVEERIYEERHASLSGLLNRIRYTGARGCGAMRGILWTPGTIRRIEKIYIDRFGEITATYQVFFCKGDG